MREEYVLVADAAIELQVSRAAIWKAIHRGQLHSERLGPLHVIPRTELDRFKTERRKPGRPRKPAE